MAATNKAPPAGSVVIPSQPPVAIQATKESLLPFGIYSAVLGAVWLRVFQAWWNLANYRLQPGQKLNPSTRDWSDIGRVFCSKELRKVVTNIRYWRADSLKQAVAAAKQAVADHHADDEDVFGQEAVDGTPGAPRGDGTPGAPRGDGTPGAPRGDSGERGDPVPAAQAVVQQRAMATASEGDDFTEISTQVGDGDPRDRIDERLRPAEAQRAYAAAHKWVLDAFIALYPDHPRRTEAQVLAEEAEQRQLEEIFAKERADRVRVLAERVFTAVVISAMYYGAIYPTMYNFSFVEPPRS